MAIPGLMYVRSQILDPNVTSDDLYNRMYNDEHLPDILARDIAKIALRYKKIDPAAQEWPYIALYPVPDATFMTSPQMGQLVEETRVSRTFGNRDIYDFVKFDMRPFEKIGAYEIAGTSSGRTAPSHVQSLVAVAVESEDGNGEGLDQWFRQQHDHLAAASNAYRRSTTYKRTDGVEPRYLVLREFDCKADAISDVWAKVAETKTLHAGLQVVQTTMFELIQVQGDKAVQL
jgi:hypothetical protein